MLRKKKIKQTNLQEGLSGNIKRENLIFSHELILVQIDIANKF